MEQMHGRGGEEHTHMRTCISHSVYFGHFNCLFFYSRIIKL